MSDETTQTTEVHNVWTIYGLNEDGTEADQPIAGFSRPQDWGAPRWTYHQFRFEWLTTDHHYINNCHCWTDLTREPHEYPQLFASLIVQIMMPGKPKELCNREFLTEDDFWSAEWGDMPPYADGHDYDDDGDDWDDCDELVNAGPADPPDLGPCCACGQAGPTVRNIVCFPVRAPVPGTGWGCVVCGAPNDGATAVLCDACMKSGAEAQEMCHGRPGEGRRVAWPVLAEPFGHDRSKHSGAGIAMLEDVPGPEGVF